MLKKLLPALCCAALAAGCASTATTGSSDRILDMIRTSINVVGDVASALVVTNLEGDLNKEPYQEGEA